MRWASALRWPWLVMGSVPPVDSMTISDQKTPVEMWTEAILVMPMLSSLLPNRRDLTRVTRCGLMMRRGSCPYDCRGVWAWFSPPTPKLSLRRTARGGCSQMNPHRPRVHCGNFLDPFERAFVPYPDVADDQDGEENQHLQQTEGAECLEAYGPGKKKNCFHVEDYEKDGDDVVANSVASASAVDGVDAAFVGHQLGLAGI